MPIKTNTERQALFRERKKLGLIRLDVWLPKKLWQDIMKLISEYKG